MSESEAATYRSYQWSFEITIGCVATVSPPTTRATR